MDEPRLDADGFEGGAFLLAVPEGDYPRARRGVLEARDDLAEVRREFRRLVLVAELEENDGLRISGGERGERVEAAGGSEVERG